MKNAENKKDATKGANQNLQEYDTTVARVLSILTDELTPAKTICQRAHISARELRMVVEHLRRNGHPIVTGAEGGYKIGTFAEASAEANKLERRAKQLLVTASAMREGSYKNAKM